MENSSTQQTKNKKRLIIGVVIGLIVFIGAIAGTVTALSVLKITPSNQVDKPVNPLRENVDSQEKFDKGAKAQFGFFEVNINKVVYEYNPPGGILPRTKGNVFLLLNITAKNTSSATHLLSDIELAVLSDDVVINSTFVQVDSPLKTAPVEPGKSLTGNLVFEVPAGKKDIKLYYNTKIYNESDKKLDKNEYTLAF